MMTLDAAERRLLANLSHGIIATGFALEALAAKILRAHPAVDERCPRCHHTAPNTEGCALCNPERLGERLTQALKERDAAGELLRVRQAEKRFYLLVRVRVVAHARPATRDGAALASRPLISPAYQPVWWDVQDHDGAAHATDGKQFTITLTSIEAKDLVEARAWFTNHLAFYLPLLKDVPALTPEIEWPGGLDDEQHDEAMAGFYMNRLVARREGQPLPALPTKIDRT